MFPSFLFGERTAPSVEGGTCRWGTRASLKRLARSLPAGWQVVGETRQCSTPHIGNSVPLWPPVLSLKSLQLVPPEPPLLGPTRLSVQVGRAAWCAHPDFIARMGLQSTPQEPFLVTP